MIDRLNLIQQINDAFEVAPVCALIGPRQCGKTTLAKYIATTKSNPTHFFDLEDERDQNRLKDPLLALENREGFIVIDEIHHAPDLFKTLRVLVDQGKNQQFLVLGSASHKLLQQSSETLAGRISYIQMHPFALFEVNNDRILHTRGGFPHSFLAKTDRVSFAWRKNYITTFLERDIRDFGLTMSTQNIRRFWNMVAHYHGQIFNASEIGTALGLNYKTVQNYCDVLESTFMVRRLMPWIENLKKRQVKAPKLYLTDSGLLHNFLGITNYDDLLGHPKLGASFEGFAIEQIIAKLQVDSESCFYWRTHNGAELDLLVLKDGKKHGFEFKYSLKPTITNSIRSALEDLKLDFITIITPGKDSYHIHNQVCVRGIQDYVNAE